MGELIKKDQNLVGITKWLNETYKVKRSGKPFTNQDAQQYIMLGRLPLYLGGYKVERSTKIDSVKIYNIIKD